jgi:hypothetical protein
MLRQSVQSAAGIPLTPPVVVYDTGWQYSSVKRGFKTGGNSYHTHVVVGQAAAVLKLKQCMVLAVLVVISAVLAVPGRALQEPVGCVYGVFGSTTGRVGASGVTIGVAGSVVAGQA